MGYPSEFPVNLKKDAKSIGLEKIILSEFLEKLGCTVIIAKKLFFRIFLQEMNFYFSLDNLSPILVSPSYFSSDENLEIGSFSVAGSDQANVDSDMEVIACYREIPIYPQDTLSRRLMTTGKS